MTAVMCVCVGVMLFTLPYLLYGVGPLEQLIRSLKILKILCHAIQLWVLDSWNSKYHYWKQSKRNIETSQWMRETV